MILSLCEKEKLVNSHLKFCTEKFLKAEGWLTSKEKLLDIFFITLCTAVINSNINNENFDQQTIIYDEVLSEQLSNNYNHNYEDQLLDYNSNLWHNEVNLLSEECRTVEVC